MSASIPMDISDTGGDRSSRNNNSLAVNKSSSKISKNARGKSIAPSRPEAKIIHIEVTDFRRTVQELTAQEPAAPARAVANARLSRIAPPPLPLRPNVSYAKMPQPPHLPALMSPTHNGQRLINPGIQGFAGFPSMQQQPRGSPRAVSPMPLLTPGTFAPLPALSPSDRWADLESPGTAFMMQAAHAMVSNAAAAAPRVEPAAAPLAQPPQLPPKPETGGNGSFPSFYPPLVTGSYPQTAPRLESGNMMNPSFGSRMDTGMGGIPSWLPRTDAATMPPATLQQQQQQFPPNMQSGGLTGAFPGAFPQFNPRMDSFAAAAAAAAAATVAAPSFPQAAPRFEPAVAANAFSQSQFPPRMESGFGNFPLSPRFDPQGFGQQFGPLSPTFGLPPLSPTMSLPPLSPTFPLSPLGFGNQDFGFGLNNVYAGFASNLSPTAGLANDAFSFPDRILS